MNPLGGFEGRKRRGGAEGPVRADVVLNEGLYGVRRSENAEKPERACAKSGK